MDTEKLSSAGACSTFARDDDECEMLPIAGTVQSVEVSGAAKPGLIMELMPS